MRLVRKITSMLLFLVSLISMLYINAGLTSSVKPVFAAAQSLEIVTNGMPSANVGTNYSATLKASGGVMPYSWSQSGLPSGFGLNTVTGEVYGKSSVAGTYQVNLSVNDSVYEGCSRQVNFTVNPVYDITSFNQGSGYASGSYEQKAVQPTAFNWTRQSRFKGTDAGVLKWSYDVGDEIFYASPAIGADGTIYIGSGGGKLNAVNPDGTFKWRYITGWDIGSSPAIGADGTIYIGSADGKLNAINPDGTLKWEYYAPYFVNRGDAVYSSPAIGTDGTIYFGANNFLIHAVNPNGTLKWTYETEGPINASPAVGSDGTIYVGSGDKKLYAIKPDGTLKWSYTTKGIISRDPVIGADGTVYFGSNYDFITDTYDCNLYAVRPDGSLKWTYNINNVMNSTPAIGNDGTVYVGAWNGRFYSIKSDGTLKWFYDIENLYTTSPIIGADGIIYVGSQDNNLYAFNPDGTVKWRYTSGDAVYSSPAIGSDGTIYFGSMDQKLYALYNPLIFNTDSMPNGEAGIAYNSTLSASGGTPAYKWSAAGLPQGLTINALTGMVSGTPAAAGNYTANVTVTDSIYASRSKAVSLIINPTKPIVLSIGSVPVMEQDNYFEQDYLSASGGIAPYTWSAAGLPAGLSIDPSTGTVSGTPVVRGKYKVNVTVTDNAGLSKTSEIELIIQPLANNETYDGDSIDNNKNSSNSSNNSKPPEGAKAYEYEIPVSFLASRDASKTLELKSDLANVVIPGNMIAMNLESVQKVILKMDAGDKSGLSENVRKQLEDKPLIQLSLFIDNKPVNWSNDDASVIVNIPYAPAAAELKDPEHITVWYIDGSGNVINVPNGRYDPNTHSVKFTVSHFSYYAVAYVQKTFTDLDNTAWARRTIEVMASKGIVTGTGADSFSPTDTITRADYLVMLIKTLGLTADFNSNFDDVAPYSYYYKPVGIARKLGITSGSGNNKFNPAEYISRQDMMVMTFSALEKFKKLKVADDLTVLDKFSDMGDIAGYASTSLAALVKEGLISGYGDMINPRACTTRAETAAFLYKIYNKY